MYEIEQEIAGKCPTAPLQSSDGTFPYSVIRKCSEEKECKPKRG